MTLHDRPAPSARPAHPGRRRLLAALPSLALLPVVPHLAHAQTAAAEPWSAVEARARGQTVWFNAWGGSAVINTYLQWVAGELRSRHGITLEHVKVTDTAEVVRRVRGEKAAGRNADGSVDLVWINGENFLTMKREGLLFGPWAEQLPHARLIDTEGKPTTRVDFGEPVDGMESPWGMAQLTFFADRSRVPEPPRSSAALLAWARANPGRFSYPRPPAFHGTTFLKQLLLDVGTDRAALAQPHTAEAFDRVTAPLWRALDELHPHLWRQGRQFPANAAAQRQMVADGELHIAITFNPNDAANEIAARRLPDTVQSFQFDSGTVGNTHFVAIPFNARAREAAQVTANFLLSPQAQARKADISHWGDPTVLALNRLTPAERALFDAAQRPGQVTRPAPVLREPHASWVDPIEREWLRRYSR